MKAMVCGFGAGSLRALTPGLTALVAASAAEASLLPIVVPVPDLTVSTGVGVTNPGFESADDGFVLLGEAEVTGTVDGSGLLSPTQGSSQLFLQTTGTIDNFIDDPFNATVRPDSAIEPFLGIPTNSIDGFVGATDLDDESQGATEGSAARQTFEVAVTSTLTFDYAFASDELDQPSEFSDTAFFTLDGEIFLLGNVETASDFTDTPGTRFDGVIPYQQFSIDLDPGVHTIGFGVVDVSDAIVNSALLIDNLVLMPEPSSLLAVAAVGLVGLRRRRAA